MILGGRDGRGRGRDTQYTCITEWGGGDGGIDGMKTMKQVWDEGKRIKRGVMKMINQEG